MLKYRSLEKKCLAEFEMHFQQFQIIGPNTSLFFERSYKRITKRTYDTEYL